MKCPNCGSRKFDVYEARGYTSKESPIKECKCGHVWRLVPLDGDIKRIDTIRQGKEYREPEHTLDPSVVNKENNMNKDKAQGIRFEDILGDGNLAVSKGTLVLYRDYIQKNIIFPCDLTGREDFQWEEIYVFGVGDKDEYAELKKTQPSYTDTYTFMSFDDQIDDKDGLMVKVKRSSDHNQFLLPLADLKVIDNSSPNHELIHDYAVWYVNY